ncbi:unnamed protein product [Ilex paraguariensis]|uniref:AP-4 complex subunit epsilon n=1 Tax=Ilex paraguariensis TaxID=185542 RepID=A0ABC8RNV9_9AQUA
MEQLKTIGRELAMGSQGGFGQSKEFLDLVKSIGETNSKAEEDRIVLHEVESLKRRIAEPEIHKGKLKEYIILLVYIEMLGHDASFGYIHAVKMTHDENLLMKRTGYLAVTLFLNEDHDLIILIVNTIQKDLKSDNYLVVCAALNAVCKLINEETVPAVLPQVVELLRHPKEAVRKKAVMALHRFYQRSSSSVIHLVSNFRKMLCDNDPGVMGAALCPLFDLITIDVNSYKDLVISFVNILKQVAERRLPKSYDYHQMPAPFIQIKLLKILAVLGNGDKQASEHMYTVVGDTMRKCDSTSNVGNAVLYECICCVSSLHPNPKLLESAADAISKFLKISPEIAEKHQLAVIDCFEDPDDTLKRKTFELLYKMTKSSNVEVIVDRMIDYMISTNDNHYKTEIASRCVELAEQFAPSNQWFIQTMNKVFEHSGDLVNIKVAHNLMRLIAEGFGEDDGTADNQLRLSAVESYLALLESLNFHAHFFNFEFQVICWVLGEYGTAHGRYSASYISGKLCDVAEAHSSDDTVKAYAVTALLKIYSFEIAAGKKLEMLPECQSLIEELSLSDSTDLQQRAYELQAVVGLDAHAIEDIMPLDASCEDIELCKLVTIRLLDFLVMLDRSGILRDIYKFLFQINKSLPLLNSYVQQALGKGAQPYIPESERSGILNVSNFRSQDHNEASTHALKFEAYERPKPSLPSRTTPVALASSTELVPLPEISYPGEVHQAVSMPSLAGTMSSELKLQLDEVQRKWGRSAYSPEPSTSNSDSHRTVNGVTHNVAGSVNSTSREISYGSRRLEVEICPEKQKLAASLFGGASKLEKRQFSSSHKVLKTNSHAVDKSHGAEVAISSETASVQTTPLQPPPDLLDLGEPILNSSAAAVDPFKQLDGLLDLSQDTSSLDSGAAGASKGPDIMSLYTDMPTSGENDSVANALSNTIDDAYIISGFSNAANRIAHGGNIISQPKHLRTGSNPKDSLEKDALVRQMGVNPSSQNPNLFRDLLG